LQLSRFVNKKKEAGKVECFAGRRI